MGNYLEEHNKCGLRVGDKVKVFRLAFNYENDWNNVWIEEMDNSLNKEYIIRRDYKEKGFEILIDNHEYCNFPYFVLEKVLDFKPINEIEFNKINNLIQSFNEI
mgnify:CR=1 FL=1